MLVLVILIAILAIWFWLYWVPKTRAFKKSLKRVSVYMGLGEIVFWNPRETFAFLRNKRLEFVGDQNGGWRSIYPILGAEAVGPIPLQVSLYNWEDQHVLTLDGQPLALRVGIWWKVEEAAQFVFEIYSYRQLSEEMSQNQSKLDPAFIRTIAGSWLKAIAESSIRAKINSMAVADIVSSQAMQLFRSPQFPDDEVAQIADTFETAIVGLQHQIREKCQVFGIHVDRLEVQHIQLPSDLQKAITETRIAFLSPVRSEREAEAAKIKLEKLSLILGTDTVALNELLKNFQNATFTTPMSLLQPLSDRFAHKSVSLPQQPLDPSQ